jgi:hypothetical protein
MASIFEPFGTYRLLLFGLFGAYGVYELVGLVAWWRSLPPLARKLVLLKLLTFRAGRLRRELAAVAALTVVAGLLILAQWRWVT